MPFIEQLGMQAAGNAVGAGMGMLLQGANNKQQIKQQQKLTDMQIAAQKQMGIFNREQQMQLWNDTNYAAQKEQMKKAGLSPGLMYGTSGGGATTANATPGNVSAPTARQTNESLGMGLQMGQAAMIQAQIELTKAQTQKTIAEIGNVPKTGANIEASTQSLLQGIENAKAQKTLTEVQTGIATMQEYIMGKTQNAAIATALTELRKATAEMDILERNNDIDAQTKTDKINIIKTQLAGMVIANDLQRVNIAKGNAEILQIGQEIAQKWAGLDLEQRKVMVQEKLAEISGKQYDLKEFQTKMSLIEQIMNQLNPLSKAGGIITGLSHAL